MPHGTYFVYILCSATGTLYVGVTNNLEIRVEQHRLGQGGRFTSMYKVRRLVYWEGTSDVCEAITREKQIKGRRRARKLALIQAANPKMVDLFDAA
jgi:putative endonuclease